MMPSGGALRVDAGSICCLSGSRALSPCSRSNTPTWAFRTFHALYLPGHRTDPRPAAAGGLDCGAVSGGVVADPAGAAVSKPSRRPCDGSRVWPGIPGGNRSRPAAGVLAPRHRVFGCYLLAQVCGSATFWTLYLLARAIVGGQQAVLAVLLTMTVTAFSSPGLEFGPEGLARPLWALLLLHSWQLIGQNRRNAWFAWSIDAGLLLLTTSAAFGLLLLLAGFAVATERGRRTLMSIDPLFALLVVLVLALPYLSWLIRAETLMPTHGPATTELGGRALHWAILLGGLL